MSKKLITFSLVLILVVVSLFAACKATSTSSTTSAIAPTQSATTAVTSTPVSTQAKWWETMWGTPEYGGTIITGSNNLPTNFDPYNWMSGGGEVYENLWIVDPTLDRRTQIDLTDDWTIYTNWKSNLAESWDWEKPDTMVVHLRQDVHWQDKPPVNGRQFTADDVVWHFDRMLGTGSGFTTPNPFLAARHGSLQKVTARDKFTVVFTFGTTSEFVNSEAIREGQLHSYEAPEVYAMGHPITPAGGGGGPPGPPGGGGAALNSALNDWHNVVGTGAFMLTDSVAASSVTYTKNPKYWAYDERYPQNKLPYIDTLKNIYLADTATSEAALRTGKIDMMQNISWQDADSLNKSNPELKKTIMIQPAQGLCCRCDRKPFSDINVRKALQLAFNLPEISKGYYGGTSGPIPMGMINPSVCKGMAIPYDQWSQELKDEYSFNPTKAKQLLADAGYPNGLQATCDVTLGMGDLQLSQVFKAYLKDIGVDINLVSMDGSVLMNMIMAKKSDDLVEWTTAQTMPPLMGMQMYVSTEPTNVFMQNDPVFDQMVKDCNTSNTIEEADQRINAVDQYFLTHHWFITTFLNNLYVYWQPYLKGYCGEKALTKGYNARYWIDQAQKKSMGR